MTDKEANDSGVMKLYEELMELKADISDAEGGKPISDGSFAKKYTGKFQISSSYLSKIKNRKYEDLNADVVKSNLELAIRDIKERMPKIKAAADRRKGYLPTALVKAVNGRVRAAMDDPYGRRIVVCLAPTGFGKTKIKELFASEGAVCVEGIQSWKSSYLAFCRSVAVAAKERGDVSERIRQDKAERIMLDALNTKSRVVVIDEANTLSGACANGIKEIVNQTGCTVVLLAIPEFWDKFLEGNKGEVYQIVNRCQRVVRQERIGEDDVKLFLEERGMSEKFAPIVAAAANKFGGLRTVVGILNEIEDHPTRAALDEAVETFDRNLAAFKVAGIER